MPVIVEGQLAFHFPEDWQASKLDQWSFYRNQFANVCGGAKAIDILAIAPGRASIWQIEVKDYRQHPRTKVINLADEVAQKVRDSLAALVAAKANANTDHEKELAALALQCSKVRVVLHLEQPAKPSKLFPKSIDSAKVEQELKRLIKAIDPHPLVVETGRMRSCQWSVDEAR